MITASHAGMLARAANKLKHIEQQINDAAMRGDFELRIHTVLDSHDIEVLKKHQFKIENRDVPKQSGFGFGIDDDSDDKMERAVFITWRG